jgi:tRNA (cmo5U34)-methyltransferase
MSTWRTQASTDHYLAGVRAAIPLAREQIHLMHRIIETVTPEVTAFADLGCGDGVLGHSLFSHYPDAHGVFVDFSEPMLENARQRFAGADYDLSLHLADLSARDWLEAVSGAPPLDVVISGFSIHHLTDERKRQLYAEIYGLLKPGGLFLNVEHVAPQAPLVRQVFDELFIDSLFAYQLDARGAASREDVERDYYARPDQYDNVLASVEEQCGWLREIGYGGVDCYLKILEIALFGGVKPA